MMVAQTQCTPAPGVQETLFAVHDSLGRLNIYHSPPDALFISLNRYLSFQTLKLLYHLRQKGNYFIPTSLQVWYIYFSFLSPSPHSQMLNGLSLLIRRMDWLLWQLEVILLSKGLCFTFGASLMKFKGLFLQNLIIYFP